MIWSPHSNQTLSIIRQVSQSDFFVRPTRLYMGPSFSSGHNSSDPESEGKQINYSIVLLVQGYATVQVLNR